MTNNEITYQVNRVGFIEFEGRQMTIHNFYVEIMGSRMAGDNSVYCHTPVWSNLHSFGTRHGGINDAEVIDIINSVGARFVLFPSVLENGYSPALVNWQPFSEISGETLGQVI